jgi:nucleotide-binding universal stress UspA family protein
MKLIVVAVDGSTPARAAVDAGIALAAAQGATLRVVHVLAAADWEARGEPRRPLSTEERHAIERALAHAAEHGVEAESEFLPLEGSPAETITGYADRIDADVIVVGSRGRSNASAAVLGSVSHDVIQHAKRPVLVVPSGARIP